MRERANGRGSVRSAEESNREWTRDSAREIPIMGLHADGVPTMRGDSWFLWGPCGAGTLAIDSRMGGFAIRQSRIVVAVSGLEMNYRRCALSGRNPDSFVQDNTLLIAQPERKKDASI